MDRINTLEQCYKKTYSFREKERKIKKANNIIIGGVHETNNEKLYEIICELLVSLRGDCAVQLGKKPDYPQGNQVRQGFQLPFKLHCSTRLQKGLLFKGLQDIRKNSQIRQRYNE